MDQVNTANIIYTYRSYKLPPSEYISENVKNFLEQHKPLEGWEEGYFEMKEYPSLGIGPSNILFGNEIYPESTIKDMVSFSKYYKTLEILYKIEKICLEEHLNAPGNEGTSYPLPFMIVDNGGDIIPQISRAFGFDGIYHCYCLNFDTYYQPWVDIFERMRKIFDFDEGSYLPGWAWGRDYERSCNMYWYSPAVKVGRKNGFLIGLFCYYSLSA